MGGEGRRKEGGGGGEEREKRKRTGQKRGRKGFEGEKKVDGM